jgi:SPP1 family phage portal protein
MEIDVLQQLIAAGRPQDLMSKIKDELPQRDVTTYLKQYDPETHAVVDTAQRPDKLVEVDGGTKAVPVCRLPVPIQKQITQLAAAFLVGNPIQLDASPIDDSQNGLLETIQRSWDDNKLDYKSKQIAEIMFSETECAEIWYTEDAEVGYWDDTPNAGATRRLRMRIVANSLGDTLYPVFNAAGDMIAFGRGYQVNIGGGTKEDHFDLYLDKVIYRWVKAGGEWGVPKTEAHPIGKIPVIYYAQPKPDWADVQRLIERFETSISNHGDTNDYFGSPIIFVSGEIEGFATKGEQGKVIEGKNGAKAEYLHWPYAPESVKMEQTTLRDTISEMTNTVNINPEKLKSLGDFSGIALKMLFLSAHLKAARKEEIFGESVQRRINYMKAAIVIMNEAKFKTAGRLQVKPKFEYYLPKDYKEVIDYLTTAFGGGIMSQDTAIMLNPLVSDPVQEIERVKSSSLDNLNA